jgi:hypothetical protein
MKLNTGTSSDNMARKMMEKKKASASFLYRSERMVMEHNIEKLR